MHNGDQAIPTTLHWKDIYTYTFRDDNSTALQEYQTNSDSWQPINLSQLSDFQSLSNKDPWWRLTTMQSQDIVDHVEQLDRFVTLQQQQQQQIDGSNDFTNNSITTTKTGFLWEVYVPYFYWETDITSWFLNKDEAHRRAKPRMRFWIENDGCDYIWERPSSISEEIVDRVFDRIRSIHSKTDSFVLFHIRRGDAKDECDTSLSRIHDYLTCTFRRKSEIASQFGQITVLMVSDEHDKCYRTAIQQLIQDGLGFGFIDLDNTIATVLKKFVGKVGRHKQGLLNEMFGFHVSKVMAEDSRIDLVLEQRRHIQCPNCTDLLISDSPHRVPKSTPIRAASTTWNFSQTMKDYQLCTEMGSNR